MSPDGGDGGGGPFRKETPDTRPCGPPAAPWRWSGPVAGAERLWLARWNESWGGFHLVGGHVRERARVSATP